MLQATHDIRKVALWLGHADIRTTEVYLRMDPSEKLEAVEAVLPGSITTTARGTVGLDLRAGIAKQLAGLGIKAIDIDPRCTVDDPNLFSHRRGAPTGRLASVVWME